MLRQRFDKLLSEGQGRQLMWLILVTLFVFFILLMVSNYLGGMTWQEVLGLFMDPGNFSKPGEHDMFRVVIVLTGVVLFSALLISVFTNVFDNISKSYRRGERRYHLKDHILILGSSKILKEILFAIKKTDCFSGKRILIMTTADVMELRQGLEMIIADKKFCNEILYYHSNRDSYRNLVEACPESASMIYIIGEDNEISHDAVSLLCLRYLEKICVKSCRVIQCYLLVNMHSTLELYQRISLDCSSKLCVEIINRSDYVAEIFLINTDFLPIVKVGDKDKYLHVIINGYTSMGRAFASMVAQMGHFPNFTSNTRTKITFIDKNMREGMGNYVANHQNLFDLCHYKYVSRDKSEEFYPKEEYGDFLDVEWEFIDGTMSSLFVRKRIQQGIESNREKTAILICHDDDATNIATSLHLPQIVYDKKVHVGVYQNEYSQIIAEATSTEKFANLYFLGDGMKYDDAMFLLRSAKGKRVNRLYDMEYGNPPAESEEDAWMRLSHAHKMSSIASANSIPIKLRCLGYSLPLEKIKISDEQIETLSELEHRRWMITMLFLGYSAAKKEERQDRSKFNLLKEKKYVHLDIAPYEELPHEQEKDMLIARNVSYILNGK